MEASVFTASPPTCSWAAERLYFSGDEYFSDVFQAIAAAQHTIDLECYIFAQDTLGERMVQALCVAATRGIKVRVIVDGIGSPGWELVYREVLHQARVEYRVFNRPPWEVFLQDRIPGPRRKSFRELLRTLNTRNHRKLMLVDGAIAFLGGMNIWDVQLESISGDNAWRDTGVMVQGDAIVDLSVSFELHWSGRRGRARYLRRNHVTDAQILARDEVLINSLRRLRHRNYKNLLKRIDDSRERIWITSAYFVPPGSLLRKLASASQRGVDVRVLIPLKSDVFFMPWVTSALYVALLKAHARVFEYQPRMLHAKTILGDRWAIVGSSNMNHRSLFLDMEVDVVLRKEESLQQLTHQFLADQMLSNEVTLDHYRARPWWIRMFGRIMLALRFFL